MGGGGGALLCQLLLKWGWVGEGGENLHNFQKKKKKVFCLCTYIKKKKL